MADDINTATVTGRVVRDAELKYTNTGTAVVTFSVANNYSRKRGDEWTDEVNYFDAVMFGKRGESVHGYLTKGQQVAVSGEMRQERWEKDGQKRSKVVLHVDGLRLMGNKSTSETQDPGEFQDDVPF